MIDIQRFDDFFDVKDIWEFLYSNNSNTTIYQSTKYNELIWNNLYPYRIILRVTPVFYVFYDNGHPILIVPLFKKIVSNSFHIFGDKAGGGYLDFIYDDTLSVRVLDECLRKLKDKCSVSCIVINHVRNNTILGAYSLGRGGVIADVPCTSILLPDSYESYTSSLSKNTRQNIRTAYNRLEKDGNELRYGFSDYEELSKEQKRELLNIYIKRQTTKYRTISKGIFPFFAKYIDIGTKAENCGNLEGVFYIRINGKMAAFFDALYDGNSIIVPRLSIVDCFNRYSPGVILLNESIKWIIENTNIRKIDLTHGDEKYKISMGGLVFQCIEGKIQI